MNVKELKEMLDKYPDDMEVIHEMYSDYMDISVDDWAVIKAVMKNGYVMRNHPTMSDENKAKEKEYLRLIGN